MANQLGNNGGRSYDFLFQPVRIDCQFTVTPTNGAGVTNLVGGGVKSVYMYSSSPSSANPLTSSSLSKGFAWIHLKKNYFKYSNLTAMIGSPNSGSSLAINASALTAGQPYVIDAVGSGPAGAVTIAPGGADSSGSLASSWFQLFDGYGNTYIMWLYVTGVGGSAPVGVSGIPVQVTIAQNATINNITTAISNVVLAIANASPAGVNLPSGVAPFTSSGAGTGTLTLTSTGTGPLPGAPGNGVIAGTAWTFAASVYNTNLACWQGVGLPTGVTPAVGAAFVATAAGVSTGGGSTGTCKVPGVSGSIKAEIVGVPNATLNPVPTGPSPNVGSWIMVQFLTPTVSTSIYDSPMVPTAPATGSVIYLSFIAEAKSVIVAGE